MDIPCKNVVPRRRKPLTEECDLNQARCPDKRVHPDSLTSQPCVGGMHADLRNKCSTELFDNLMSKSALAVVKNLEGRRERTQSTIKHKNKHVRCTRSEMVIGIQHVRRVKESKTFKSTIHYNKERAAKFLSPRTEKTKTEYGVNVCTDLGLESIVLPGSGSYDKASLQTDSFGHGSRERHSSSSSDDRSVSEDGPDALVSAFHNLQVNDICTVPVDTTPSVPYAVPYATSQLEQGDIGFPGLRIHCQATGSEGPTPFDGYCPNTGDLDSQDTHILRKIRNFHKDSPKHLDFASRWLRRSSFRISTLESGVVNSLVEAGFFCTGVAGRVNCFCCGVCIEQWNTSDEPLFVHIRIAPSCVYPCVYLGDEMYTLYKSNLETHTENNGQIASLVEEADVGGAIGGTVDSYAPRSVKRSLENTRTGYVFSDTEMAAVNIRTPDFACYNVRISTFSQWPPGLTQTPASLATAGFYYTGMNDIVRCYACDVGLQRWDEGDDPWIEHAKWHPECPHVLRVKGSEFIELVQTTLASNVEFELDLFEVEDVQTNQSLGPGSGNSFVDVSISKGISSFESTENSLINRGYSKSDIFKALEICIASRRPKTVTSLIRIIESLKINDISRVQPENNASKLLAETNHLRQIVFCMNCEENQSNMLFLPCAHHCLCVDCAHGARICPLCTSEIQEMVKTFMA